LAILAVLLLLPGITFASETFAKGLLWKVENKNSKPSFILGTMHTEDSRVLSLPDPVTKVFESTSSFTLEVKLDSQVALETLSMMMLKDSSNLKTILGKKLFAKSSSLMADYGMPESMVNRLKPWAIFVTLSTPKNQTGQFLDKVLYDRAISDGKSIYGLETAKEQLAIFNDVPISEQIILLEDTIKNYGKLPDIIEEMTRIYLARNLGALVALNEKYIKDGNAQITNKLMKRLVVDRNIRMVNRMANQLKTGNAFIAVGALHLPGENGILNLLQNKGHKVSVVY